MKSNLLGYQSMTVIAHIHTCTYKPELPVHVQSLTSPVTKDIWNYSSQR